MSSGLLRGRGTLVRAASLAAVAAIGVAAPLSGQSRGDLHFRTGVVARVLCGVAVTPGIEATSSGATHLFASVDAYLRATTAKGSSSSPP